MLCVFIPIQGSGEFMTQLQSIWRDPVWSKVIATGLVAGLGFVATWAWKRKTAASVGFWTFLKSQAVFPVWFVAVLVILTSAFVAVVLLWTLKRLFGRTGFWAIRLNEREQNLLCCLAITEGGKSPTALELATGLKATQVEVEHAIDRLCDFQLIDYLYGDSGRHCWLTPAGRAYVVKHKVLSKALEVS